MFDHRWTAALALFFITASAQADIHQSLLDCKQLTDNSARLSCYDRLAATFGSQAASAGVAVPGTAVPGAAVPGAVASGTAVPGAVASGTAVPEAAAPASAPAAVVATPATVAPSAEVIEADFGKTQSRPSDQVEQLQATVKSLSRNKMRKMLITLENGHTWRQTEDDSIQLKAGDSVTIEKASFGSFLLSKTGTNRKVRVKRVE